MKDIHTPVNNSDKDNFNAKAEITRFTQEPGSGHPLLSAKAYPGFENESEPLMKKNKNDEVLVLDLFGAFNYYNINQNKNYDDSI